MTGRIRQPAEHDDDFEEVEVPPFPDGCIRTTVATIYVRDAETQLISSRTFKKRHDYGASLHSEELSAAYEGHGINITGPAEGEGNTGEGATYWWPSYAIVRVEYRTCYEIRRNGESKE